METLAPKEKDTPKQAVQSELLPPFPVTPDRFDQKNEMFKRAVWDKKFTWESNRVYREVKFQEKVGFRKIDYALRNASWNLEWGAGFGNACSNSGLYAWEGVNDRIRHMVEAGDQVKETPEEMSRIIKLVARYFGAGLVGIAGLHPSWVYSHEYNTIKRRHYPLEIPEGCDSAIVMAIEMNYETMRMAPNAIQGSSTGMGYSKMAFLANLMATFIRGLGYRAIPSGNDTALSVPLAMAAGLGELGRHGILITQKFGPRVRLCKVFTDLPLQHDSYKPFGVTKFCETCKICAMKCPSQAIERGDKTTEGKNISNHSGVSKWFINAEKCFGFWAKNRMDCSTCVRACPFNKPSGRIHDFTRSMIRLEMPFLNQLILWGEKAMGYGRIYDSKRFWKSE